MAQNGNWVAMGQGSKSMGTCGSFGRSVQEGTDALLVIDVEAVKVVMAGCHTPSLALSLC